MTDRQDPLFSVITPVYAPPLDVLRSTVESVRSQTWDDWELILVDDCSPDPAVRELLRSFAEADPRIRVIERAENGHIVAASNDGVAAACGEFLVLLDHDDLLLPQALALNAARIRKHADVDYLYSDEVVTDLDGEPLSPFRKPDWSPERLRNQNYCCHLSVLRTSLVREVGGFRAGFDGSQDHDLVLRVTEKARRVEHIAEYLYHWRTAPGSVAGGSEAKPYAAEAAQAAVVAHLDRVGIDAAVLLDDSGHLQLARRLPAGRRVSIVVAGTAPGQTAVRSALAATSHQDVEVVVAHAAGTVSSSILDELVGIAGDRLVLVRCEPDASRERLLNLGALVATGDRLVLLDADAEIVSDEWLTELVAPLEEDDVALTGARQVLDDGTIWHVGMAFVSGRYVHPYLGMPTSTRGIGATTVVNREVSGVSTGCAAVRRDRFLEVGGLREGVGSLHAEADLAYKLRESGGRVLVLPRCEVVRHAVPEESGELDPTSRALVRRRWGIPGDEDPFTPDYPGVPRAPEHRRVFDHEHGRLPHLTWYTY